MRRILFVSDDLLFWSRVEGLARSAGTQAVRIGDEAGMERAFREGGVTRVIVDLGVKGLDLGGWATRWAGADPRPELVSPEMVIFATRAVVPDSAVMSPMAPARADVMQLMPR